MATFLDLWNSTNQADKEAATGIGPPYEGELFYDGANAINPVDAGNDAANKSLKPFTSFKCGAVDVATELQYCYRYQLKDNALFWADGEEE